MDPKYKKQFDAMTPLQQIAQQRAADDYAAKVEYATLMERLGTKFIYWHHGLT